ncbi:hypothetical protein AHMF7605_00855 [Adhaeribacter arboris]|uniref:Uncharacterized protein n=1 Tax=Adhaeribacter arboris TaxID=2072846 RepID=A0A2T2Y9H6_9BACT|nr:hypothetical protein AHMF7605_00855 [Adhaeribacter arboris]
MRILGQVNSVLKFFWKNFRWTLLITQVILVLKVFYCRFEARCATSSAFTWFADYLAWFVRNKLDK